MPEYYPGGNKTVAKVVCITLLVGLIVVAILTN